MRMRYMFLIITLAFTIQASAQIGIYGTFTGSHLGGVNQPYPYTGSTGFWVAGGTFGIYDDFIHAGPVHLGIDLRGNILDSKGHKLNSGLAGVRIDFRAPAVPLRPYLQASVGAGNTNYGGGNATDTGLLYQVLGGLDLAVLPRIDWRVIEIGGGGLHTFDQAHVGTNFPVATISTGIVLRLP